MTDEHDEVALVRLDAPGSAPAPNALTIDFGTAAYPSVLDPAEAGLTVRHYDKTLDLRRPSFRDLRQHLTEVFDQDEEQGENADGKDEPFMLSRQDTLTEGDVQTAGGKFGTWDGVFASCLLNIFGVIMFLRLGWVVGKAGWLLTFAIIALAVLVVTLTTLSMSAIATNGEVKAGGAYYLISRSVGPRIGGAIGFLFAIGNSIAVSMYVIGFMETLTEQMGDPVITNSTINEIRVLGILLVTLLLIMALIGVGWVIKLQLVLLLLLLASIMAFMIGSFIGPDKDKGFLGWGDLQLSKNAGPSWDAGDKNASKETFFSVFAVFFPAVTGIMAGANISGDLRDPGQAIPKGTLSAISFSAVVYATMAFFIGAVCRRIDLIDNYTIMANVAGDGSFLIYAGIYAATFSSALGALVGAPRVLNTVAKDNIVPWLRFFAKTRRNGDPVRGYFLAYFIAVACVAIGDLNAVAPLISMFFMGTYALVNFSCWQLSVSKSPGWRPNFRWFNRWTALIGMLFCIVIMFLLDWIYAIIATAIAVALYFYIDYVDPPVNWGNSIESYRELEVTRHLIGMEKFKAHTKKFRPNFLVMSGAPSDRPSLLGFVSGALYKAHGLIMFGHVYGRDQPGEFDYRKLVQSTEFRSKWAQRRYLRRCTGRGEDVLGFLDTTVAPTLRQGAQALFSLSGLGCLRPNTFVLGWKKNWRSASPEAIDDYVNTLRDAFARGFGCMLTRGLEQIDWQSPPIENSEARLDCWWLFDDGGLSLLIPWLVSRAQYFRGIIGRRQMRVRLFVIAQSSADVRPDLLTIGPLLKRFRLGFDEPEIVFLDDHEGESSKKRQGDVEMHTLDTYHSLRADVTPLSELPRGDVARNLLRVSELMRLHSHDATMCFVSMPFPRIDESAVDFLAIAHTLLHGSGHAGPLRYKTEDEIVNQGLSIRINDGEHDDHSDGIGSNNDELNEHDELPCMPPTILMRGNGKNVLTFYSE
ncbi:MAG: hypothetical protein MHM6MM_002199 [Cercozoa sp. M6MM]